MAQLHNIPTRPTPFPFLQEVDFAKFAEMLDGKDGATLFVRPAGREDDIEETRLALMSGGNSSSVWVQGEEGVGKTTVISGLLQQIARKEVTASLLERHCYIFNAHNFFKGNAGKAFEEFDKALDYLKADPSLLIFDRIDDFVTTAGSDATFYANALIDCLNDGGVQAIITSQVKTRDALDRASTGFAPSFVEQVIRPSDRAGLLAALRANRPRLERIHGVQIPEEAIQETARLLGRYPGRAFTAAWPQGPLALIDKASAYVRMSRYGLPPDVVSKTEKILQLEDELGSLRISSHGGQKRIEEVQAEIAKLKIEVEPARKAWDEKYRPYLKALADIAEQEKAAAEITRRAKPPQTLSNDPEKDKPRLSASDRQELDQTMELLEHLHRDADKAHAALNAETPQVGRSDIQRVFSKAARMSLSDISGDERAKLLHAEDAMGKRVFGQEKAVKATADILRAARTGVADPERPAGIILYVGPTGTGKTELARTLAEVDGGEGAKPIIFRMNKFKEESAISQFTGADPGLVGYSEEGPPKLRQIRQNPRCIPLLDEIEKAHENFFDVNMSMLEDGLLVDSAGNEVSFKDAIIPITSNVLLPEDMKDYDIDWKDQDAVQEALRDALKKKINPKTCRPYFKEEFVERIDQIVMFDYLKAEAACSILRKEIEKQNKSLEGRNYRLQADDKIVTALIDKYFKPCSNGRTVRQFYNRLIRPQISTHILSDPHPPTEDQINTIEITFDGDAIRLTSADADHPARPAVPTTETAQLNA